MDKNTQELLDILKDTKNIASYVNDYSGSLQSVSLSEYLERLLTEKNLKKSRCIQNANLQRNYGYQIFSGERLPSRDKVLSLCIAMGLTSKETHTLLCSTGYPDLYPKNKRDSILIFALEKKMTIMETNDLLYEMEERMLSNLE